jgi:hypothetical protein
LAFLLFAFSGISCPVLLHAEAGGASSAINGTVTDPSGAVVPGATVEIRNPVSGYARTAKTDSAGNFSFPNVPLNPYHVTANLGGFAPYVQDVDVRSSVPLTVEITLQISSSAGT